MPPGKIELGCQAHPNNIGPVAGNLHRRDGQRTGDGTASQPGRGSAGRGSQKMDGASGVSLSWIWSVITSLNTMGTTICSGAMTTLNVYAAGATRRSGTSGNDESRQNDLRNDVSKAMPERHDCRNGRCQSGSGRFVRVGGLPKPARRASQKCTGIASFLVFRHPQPPLDRANSNVDRGNSPRAGTRYRGRTPSNHGRPRSGPRFHDAFFGHSIADSFGKHEISRVRWRP